MGMVIYGWLELGFQLCADGLEAGRGWQEAGPRWAWSLTWQVSL